MSRLLVYSLVILTFLVTAIGAVSNPAEDDVATRGASVYYVSTLVPGEGSIPPQFSLSVDHAHGKFTLEPLKPNWAEQIAQWLIHSLGLVQDRVSPQRSDLCHSQGIPELFSAMASFDENGTRVACNPGVLEDFALDKFWFTREYHQLQPQDALLPLSVTRNEECTRVPFSFSSLDAYTVAAGRAVITVSLKNEFSSLNQPMCTAWFELREAEGSTGTSQGKSLYRPVVMVAIMIALRMLPRYILTRKGQLDPDSYRGTVPKLSSSRMAELKQQQREIIAQMKEEDERNGLTKKNR